MKTQLEQVVSSGSNLTFGTPSTFINFTDVVVFTDLSTSGTTTINGDNITTGTIKAINLESTNFSQNANTSAVIAGSRFNLANGQIDSKEFSIDSNGDANFAGTVEAGAVVSANISANQITSGTLNASNVNVTNLQAGNMYWRNIRCRKNTNRFNKWCCKRRDIIHSQQ